MKFIFLYPWQKCRIVIQSEPIRNIPIHSDICIRANVNHSEPIRKTFYIQAKVSNWNSLKVNQNYSDSFRYLYPSQSESFSTNPKNVLYLVWWKTVKNQSDLIRLPRQQCEWIRINPTSDWFGLIWIANLVSHSFEFIRIDVSELIGLIFNRFSSNEIQSVFRIGSEWFVLARIQISEWIGIVLIGSE